MKIILMLFIFMTVIFASIFVILAMIANMFTNMCKLNYNKNAQKMLAKYGNEKITRIYVFNVPITTILVTALNIISLYKFSHLLHNEYHMFIIVKLKLPNGVKFLKIEKSPHLQIQETFQMFHYGKSIKTKTTLNELLGKTHERIGGIRFFSWNHLNNCQEFTKELLKTLKKKCHLTHYTLTEEVSSCTIIQDILNHIISVLNFIESRWNQ